MVVILSTVLASEVPTNLWPIWQQESINKKDGEP
jgi:hypothetical protein